MTSASFPHRMDPDLWPELERIAEFEHRSASDMANLAIRAFVEERQATRDLLREGLRQVDAGAAGLSPAAVHDWLLAEDDRPFPQGARGPLPPE